MINTRSGDRLTFDEVKQDLLKDHIRVQESNKELISKSSSVYKSRLQQAILANRYDDAEELEKNLKYTLSDIVSKEFIEEHMPIIKVSTKILLNVMDNNEHIVVVSDYDVDGVTSGAILYYMLHDLFKYDNVEYIINRRDYGNGINKTITSKLINYDKEKKIGLLITSDAGSHDEESYKLLKQETDMKIIVTDHHLFSEDEFPHHADALVNPQRSDNDFKYITGTHVAYYTILHAYLTRHPVLTKEAEDLIYYKLLYVGMSTISDCMDLKRYINRKVVKYMLTELNRKDAKHDPFWEYIIKNISDGYLITETTLSYNVISMLNSPGRVSDPRISFELLTADNITIAEQFHNDIKTINDNRKAKQNKALTTKNKTEYTDGVIKVMLIDDINGVQGIVANNVMYEDGYKAVIVFSKITIGDKTVYIGSGRSQDDNINLKAVLDKVNEKSDSIISYGGHEKAVGIKIKDDLKKFYLDLKSEIDKCDVRQIEFYDVEDYIFSVKKIITSMADIDSLAPYGIGFPQPKFAGDFHITSYRIYDRKGFYLSMKVTVGTNETAIMSAFYPVKGNEVEEVSNNLKYYKDIRMVFTLDVNTYKAFNRIQINVDKLIFKKDEQ